MKQEKISSNYSDLIKSSIIDFSLDLSHSEEERIIKKLPPIKSLNTFTQIYQIKGVHHPCIHDAIPKISKKIKIRNNSNRKSFLFTCNTEEEAVRAVESINSKLSEYGYNASSVNNHIYFKTSQKTSLIPLLHKNGYRPLYCEHVGGIEKIVFASNKPKKIVNLKNKIKNLEYEASKQYGKKISLPNQITKLRSKIYLPDIEHYSPNFISFLIDEKLTPNQIKTSISLYKLAEIGIPFDYINIKSLIRIVHAHTGIAKRSLMHYLYENDCPLQKKIAFIYPFEDRVMRMPLNRLEMENTLNRFKEACENKPKLESKVVKTRKINIPETKIDMSSVEVNNSKLIKIASTSIEFKKNSDKSVTIKLAE